MSDSLKALIFVAACATVSIAGCAHPNPFKGTWSGEVTSNGQSYKQQCTFTDAFVTCEELHGTTKLFPFGGAYTVRTSTEAVAPNAGFDFNILPNGTMSYSNGAMDVTLTRVSE